jgi:hypothetical protein
MTAQQRDELYSRMVSSHPDAVLKGDTIPYTSLNGNMYSFLSKDGFVGLRLPEDERVKFLEKYKTVLAKQYGAVQKEYVVVPDSLLDKGAEINGYFRMSYRYVSSLKPKPTTKPKKKK